MRILVVDYYEPKFHTTGHIWDTGLTCFVFPSFEELEVIFPPHPSTVLRVSWVVGILDPEFKIYSPELRDAKVQIEREEKRVGYLPTQNQVHRVRSISLTLDGSTRTLDHYFFNDQLPWNTGGYVWDK